MGDDDVTKRQVRKAVEEDYKKRNKKYNDDDSDDEGRNRNKKQRRERPPEKTVPKKEPLYSRQYRDRAKERREGISAGNENEEDVVVPTHPPSSVADVLFDAATLAVETGEIGSSDLIISNGDHQQERAPQNHHDGYPVLNERCFESAEQALDWLKSTASTSSTAREQPKTVIARNICQWLREQQNISQGIVNEIGSSNTTLQQQLHRSCYEFRTHGVVAPWEPPVLDNAYQVTTEPWEPMPENLFAQIDTSMARIKHRSSGPTSKNAFEKNKNVWVPVVASAADEDDIFAGAGTEYKPEASSAQDDGEREANPFQSGKIETKIQTSTVSQAPGMFENKALEQNDGSTRLHGFSESNTLDEGLFVGVAGEEDGRKKSKKRRRRAKDKGDADSD